MLDRNHALLIVTDIQGNLAEAMHDRDNLYRNLGILIDGFRILDIPILWLEQYPEGLGQTVPEVSSHLSGLAPVPKKSFSALDDTGVLAAFKAFGRDQVLLAGIETHICIYQTTSHLLKLGITTYVVSDAVSSRTNSNRKLGLDMIAHLGGKVTGTEAALFELLQSADDPAFKEILRLVR